MKTSIVSHSRRALAAVVCVATVAIITACDTDEIGAAAVVGGDRITIGELQDQVRAVTESAPDGGEPTGDQAEMQRTLLERTIQHELLASVGRDEGVEVTEAEIDAFIDEQILSQTQDGDIGPLLAENALTETTLREFVRDQLVATALIDTFGGQEQLIEALTAEADALGVEVSPRFGTWSGIALEPSSGSISEPADGEPAPGAPAETPAG
ncbi:MAG TPA: SurA N-terminal domain-containing protein [Jiangellaceae bacterium]|nr:SurA N-terminal domain-containing protein [Jiangellaceae bacterium]